MSELSSDKSMESKPEPLNDDMRPSRLSGVSGEELSRSHAVRI
jgi:hypothetical protein